ncbi:carbohydrate-binding domain-containing protein [Flavobacterium hungaricum]|uniref:Carbohydrate-binding domain-containing protein n=1 Tax=Flavobacterium hungaricum TaxID=2082725 RepID=A0ABR9TGE2_9FLAO|nr:carbohydrate-binding domain-containing protein [Flavobacterium hungaricum]MBE8724418.1 carbohydrate-binding domain-containing protein [Flavobacterium hungaricum]
MKTKRYFYSCLLLGIAIVSCSKDSDSEDETIVTADSVTISAATAKGTAEGSSETGANADDILANSTFTSTVKITFNGTTATVENGVTGVTVTTSGADVTVTSTAAEIAYEITGSTTDGMLKIYSDKKYKLTLNGVSIRNSDGPAINIQSGKRAFIVLNGTNTLEDGVTYTTSTEDQKGTFFSEGQLIFSGTGILNITGNNKHAIAADDYVRVQSGTITITKAASDGIHTNDGVYIDGGTLNINASSDGIEAEEGPIVINAGTITITAADDGITASYDTDTTIDPYVVINGGTISITTTGTGGEGIESKSTLTINGGTINIKAVDDGINAGKAIYINDGTITSYSTTNDGIDSNGTLTVTGGKIFAIGAKSPEEGFDCDNNTFKITGGLLVGAGGATSSPTASVSTQASAILGSGNAGIIYSVLDPDNSEVMTFKSPASFTTLLLSGSKFSSGKTYKLVTVSSVANASEFNGLYLGGTFSDPVLSSSFTLTSMVTKIGGSTGGGR